LAFIYSSHMSNLLLTITRVKNNKKLLLPSHCCLFLKYKGVTSFYTLIYTHRPYFDKISN
jgi:hypothetical protein